MSPDEMRQFYEEFKGHVIREDADRQRIFDKMDENKISINNLTSETKDLISAWEALSGTIKVLNAFSKLLLWVGSLTSVGALTHWFTNHFSR